MSILNFAQATAGETTQNEDEDQVNTPEPEQQSDETEAGQAPEEASAFDGEEDDMGEAALAYDPEMEDEDEVDITIPDMSYKNLEKAQEAIAEALREKRMKQRAADLNTAKVLVARHGFKWQDIKGKAGAATGTRKKVPAKYRDPVSGAEWSGRGKAPAWIRDQDREPFLIS